MATIISARAVCVALLLTLTTSAQGLLTAASKTNGEYGYNFATVPLLAELLKATISAALLQRDLRAGRRVKMTMSLQVAALYIAPAVIYLVHNNVQFFTLRYLDPATYQVLGNLKIVSTGVLFRFALGRPLSRLQWLALLLLTLGATTSQISCTAPRGLGAPLPGYLFALASTMTSATAAVYTEYVMKARDDALYWQNVQLYSIGALFNVAALSVASLRSSAGFWLWSMFKGYNTVTWLVVANLALSGLLVSWIMKFADSILKVFATSMAMLLTMIVSAAAFGTALSLQLVLGIAIACCALHLYYLPSEAHGSSK